eukprot:112575-Chlamydomonas_euryale.AAC.4
MAGSCAAPLTHESPAHAPLSPFDRRPGHQRSARWREWHATDGEGRRKRRLHHAVGHQPAADHGVCAVSAALAAMRVHATLPPPPKHPNARTHAPPPAHVPALSPIRRRRSTFRRWPHFPVPCWPLPRLNCALGPCHRARLATWPAPHHLTSAPPPDQRPTT